MPISPPITLQVFQVVDLLFMITKEGLIPLVSAVISIMNKPR